MLSSGAGDLKPSEPASVRATLTERTPATVDVSVILVLFRSDATLPVMLRSLTAAMGRLAGRSWELVVVENGPQEMGRRIVLEHVPTATCIANPHNRGFAAAMNQGMRQARGQWVVLLNPDAELAPDVFEQLLAAAEREPRAGLLAPRLLDADGRPVLSCYPFLTVGTVVWRHFQVYRLFPDRVVGRYRRQALAPAATEPLAVDWAQGACLLIRREVLREIGLLDERFVFYCEEVDFCLRAAQAGWQTYYVPLAQVRHAEGSSSGQVVPFKLASHYLSKAIYFHKHRGVAEATVLRAALLLDLGLRVGYRLVSRPPDMRARLASYRQIMGLLLTASPARLEREWRAMAAGLSPSSASSSVTPAH